MASTGRLDFPSRFRESHSPRMVLSDLLMKNWMEPVVPFVLMVALIAYFSATIPNYATVSSGLSLVRLNADFCFVALGMAITLIAGGIDLSVGAIFAACNFAALFFLLVVGVPLPLVVLGTLLTGIAIGCVNGFLIGYLKARPFLTTLVTLIVLRAAVNLLNNNFAVAFATGSVDSAAWRYLANGTLFGIPFNAVVLAAILAIGHILLSRSRYGWHFQAVGSSRKAARHAGIAVQRTQFLTYVLSGFLCAIAGIFYAARHASTDSTTGAGWEFQALTAVILGGVSLAGGRGTVWRAMIGCIIVVALSNGLVRLGVPGHIASAAIGLILIIAVSLDVKWSKNRGKALEKIYINPGSVHLAPSPSITAPQPNPVAMNARLTDAEPIGLGQVEGPEDIILDRRGRLYGSTRDGNIIRFSEDFTNREVFARIGGRPLGMQFDANENLIVAVAGMGVYGVRPDGEVFKVTDQTNRTWYKLNNDTRLRMADDLDIGPDGKIYFSDCTTRYEMTTSFLELVEARPNGRVVVHDPKTGKTETLINHLYLPNGVCVSHDGRSLLVASTSFCQVYRYWLKGPDKGKLEVLIENIPGFCDNINRASDGTYWLALFGVRGPAFDLALRAPGFRQRMAKQLPSDEWLVPSLNYGCVLKFNEKGEFIESFWDPTGQAHSTVTSMREHRGYLYLGGLENNRIGRIRLDGADPDWTSFGSYWEAPRVGVVS